MTYGLPAAYRSQHPAPYEPVVGGPVWQPDVYPWAAGIARQLGAARLIDVGCSTGSKLLACDGFALIGLDLPGQLPTAPGARWIPADLSEPGPLPLAVADLEGAVLICSDVIEHLPDPSVLVAALRCALDHAVGLALSTPDRDRTRGRGDLGPPANRCHAREWTATELVAWLEAERLPVAWQGWQRSTDRATTQATTVCWISGRGLRSDTLGRDGPDDDLPGRG